MKTEARLVKDGETIVEEVLAATKLYLKEFNSQTLGADKGVYLFRLVVYWIVQTMVTLSVKS